MNTERLGQPAFKANPEAQQMILDSPFEWFARLKEDIHRLYQDTAYLEHRQGVYDDVGKDTATERIENVALYIEQILLAKLNYAYGTWDLPHGMQFSEQNEEELRLFQQLMITERIAPKGIEWYDELSQDAHTLIKLLHATPCYAQDLPNYADRYRFDLEGALTALRDLDILDEGDVVHLKVSFLPTHVISKSSKEKFPELYQDS